VTSLTIIALESRPAKAESFLSRTVCGVTSILGVECRRTTPAPQAPSQTPQPVSQPTDSSSPSTSPAETSGTTGAATMTPVAPAPLEITVEPINPTPIAPLSMAGSSTVPSSRSYLANTAFVPTSSSRQVLGIRNEPLRTSEEGWRIFGIAWYWWAIVFFSVFTVLFYLKRRLSARVSVS